MENPEAYLGRLKPIYIFRGLTDDQIVDVARELEFERHPAGTVIFNEKDEGDHFYIINRGQVKVLRQGSGREPKHIATLVPGDFFGETSLLYGRRRSATIETDSDVELLRLSKEDFERLLRQYPQMRPNFLLSTESRELYRRQRFNWLGPNEVVYLIARKHRILLYQAMFPPILVFALVALAAIWLAVYYEAMWIAWAGVLLELPVLGWLGWNSIDWSNDYYIVTNQRLMYLEKIVGIYDSRQEAPLNSILSVNVQTDDSIQRAIKMGDVVVRTFSGPITIKSVANPNVFAAAIEEHWHRTRTRERESQLAQMQTVLRDRLEHGPTQAQPPVKPAPKPKPKPPSLNEQLRNFISFRVRFEQNGSVVYRKHWFMLIHRIWKPSLGLFVVGVLSGIALAGLLPAAIPLTATLLVLGVLFIPLAGWWLYEYVDWKNDIYMITDDQIFDITRKPLGAETKKSAPLGNVLSLKYERPGLLGYLLNFGTVVAQVAGSEFRFEGVFDPVAVQNDVYRRMEAQKNKQAAAEDARKRDEMADWLTVYHRVQAEREDGADQLHKPRRGAA